MKTWADLGIDVRGQSSGEVATTCPWCSKERKKKTARCLNANLDKGVYICHHCGESGSLGGDRNKPLVMHWQKPTYRKPEPKPDTGLPEKVIAWFKTRSIPEDVLIRNKIASGKVYMPQVEDWVTAIRFPYFRGNDLVNIKYRDGNKHFRMEVGAERILYGLSDLAETTIIVEGEMDKLSLEVAGFTNCVSVPDGAPATNTKDYASKFTFLDADDLTGVREWIIAVDSDEPGKRLEDELARRFGRERCRLVKWPADCKDANEVLVKHGREVLSDCIEHAEAYPLKGVFDVRDFTDRVSHLYEHGWECGLSTGWWSMDECYTVRPGEMTVITGIPNSGKSNWTDALMVNMAKKHGWSMAVFSPENQPIEDHIARLAEKWVGAPFGKGPTERMTENDLKASMDALQSHFYFILDDDESDWTLDRILDNAATLVFRHGVRGLLIDPWNELEHQRPREQSETEYISASLKRIRQFARQKGVHVWIVAHPAKLYRDKEGNYPVPTMYDISGSAHWRNKADNGICIWRNFTGDSPERVEVHVQKVRFRQVGQLGLVELEFRMATHTYRDVQLDYAADAYRSVKGGE